MLLLLLLLFVSFYVGHLHPHRRTIHSFIHSFVSFTQAIYILIAGSYTPFLLTVNDPDSARLFVLLWCLAAFGVCFHACYSGNFKAPIETTCYLVMGWIAAFKVPLWMEVRWRCVAACAR